MPSRLSDEERFRIALKRITVYPSAAELRRQSGSGGILNYNAVLEQHYEDVIEEARAALRAYRKQPIPKETTDAR